MTRDVYFLKMSGSQIDGGLVTGTGAQIAAVVSLVASKLEPVTWFVADVDVIGPCSLPRGAPVRLCCDTTSLMNILVGVDQFLSGVFLAVPSHIAEPSFRNSIGTEDDLSSDLGDSLVEIRAFDTTSIDVVMSRRDLLDSVASQFRVDPLQG